eukprot:GSMAST32.ASY1.ANO1.78.1 assembled CDS
MDGAACGFDIVIVCTSNTDMENFWQLRLNLARGSIIPINTIVVVVTEDWDGASAALYHTAGKGTRLAPLPGSECNNKPAVKLPGLVRLQGVTTNIPTKTPVTILESVIRQTGVCIPGRLSVFWGDQLFIPSVKMDYTPVHHADILCMLGPMPSANEWKSRGLSAFGLIAVNSNGDFFFRTKFPQVEKVDYRTATNLLQNMGKVVSVGTSLGSFSVSFALLNELMMEFKKELSTKIGKLDSDPHWWMPLTLPRSGYITLMQRKGMSNAGEHWDRIAVMKKRFMNKELLSNSQHFGLFGAVDVGSEPFWWDYGQLHSYMSNNIKLTQCSIESDAMKKFFGVDSSVGGSVELISSKSKGLSLNSVVVDSTVGNLNVENCVLFNVSATSLRGKNCLVYNLYDSSLEGLDLPDGTVLCDIPIPNEKRFIRMQSTISVNAGTIWKEIVHDNEKSFEEIYLTNNNVSLADAEKLCEIKRKAIRAKLM